MTAAPKWTGEQREAITDAHDIGGLTYKEIAAAAVGGSLEYQGRVLAPFDLDHHQARDVAFRVRGKRAPADRATRIEALDERLLVHAEKVMRALERSGAGKMTFQDLRRFQSLAATVAKLRDNEQNARSLRSHTAPSQAVTPAPGPDADDAPVGPLIAAYREHVAREEKWVGVDARDW